MAAKVSVSAIEPFDPKADSTSLNSRWTKWMKCFKTYLLAANITDPTREGSLAVFIRPQCTMMLSGYPLNKSRTVY